MSVVDPSELDFNPETCPFAQEAARQAQCVKQRADDLASIARDPDADALQVAEIIVCLDRAWETLNDLADDLEGLGLGSQRPGE